MKSFITLRPGSKLFDTDGISERIFSKKLIYIKKTTEDKKYMENYPGVRVNQLVTCSTSP